MGNFHPLCHSCRINSTFSARDTNHRIPEVTDVRNQGVPLDTTCTSSVHCNESTNTARRLLFVVHQSFCELSKAALIPLYCVIVRPHLEYAVETNAPTLRADVNQRLATRLVRGLRHVPCEERLRQLNLFSLERRRPRVDLNPPDFFLRPPRAGLRGHTYRLLQGPSRLRRRSGAFSHNVLKYWNRLPAPLVLLPSVFILKKPIGPSMVRNLSCSTCIIFVPLHRHFSLYRNPRLFMFTLPPKTGPFMWLLMTLVA